MAKDEKQQETPHVGGRVNFLYQMDTNDSIKNSILACWISNNNIQDIKSVTLSKNKVKHINDVMGQCGDWVLKASRNRKWLNKQKFKTNKNKTKMMYDQLLKNYDPAMS